MDRRGRREGKIVEVLTRKTEQFVGRYYCESGIGLVTPHSKRITQEILIPGKRPKNVNDGDFFVVKITQGPNEHMQQTGQRR